MILKERIQAFAQLGKVLSFFINHLPKTIRNLLIEH